MLAIIVALPLVLFPPVFDAAWSSCGVEPQAATREEVPALDLFRSRLDAYMQIHNDVERRLAPKRLFDDPEDLFDAIRSMRSGIRDARPDAGPGSVFTAEVSALIRARLAQRLTACNYTVEEVLAFLNEERLPGTPKPRVNGPFPWTVGSAMWPTLLAALPPLSAELQYRFVDRDLVLIDMHADLVVDIVEGALPSSRHRLSGLHHAMVVESGW
jgi:hypothetical protein